MYAIDWLDRQASTRPNKVALVDVATDRKYTYAEFNERASRFAEYLRDEWKLKKGDRVAVLSQNSSEYLEMLYGCAKVGVIMVCLNWRLSVKELEFIVHDAEPEALVYTDGFISEGKELALMNSIEKTMVVGQVEANGHVAYEDALARSSGERVVMKGMKVDDAWHLLYTSGTTGRPKGVVQTFGMVLFNAVNVQLVNRLNEDDVFLNVLPFFHTGGLNLYTNPILHVGGTVHIMNAFDVEKTMALLSNEVTTFFGVPAIYLFICQHPKFKEAKFANVRHWACGGSPIANALLEEYLAKDIIICFGFGMTETGPTVFLTDENVAKNKIGTVGKPVIHVQTKVVDPTTHQTVGPNERGELLIRGPSITPGYWRLEEATKKAIDSTGWLNSGDIAYYDEDGDYFIVDRSKDMFISGGENVYPAEVENVIYAMDGVQEVAVIGVPDDKWVEVGKAIVVVDPNSTIDEDAIKAHCKAQLAGYKVPKHYEFVELLPRNASGKVEKQQLRKLYGG